MGKNQSASNLPNIIQHNNGSINFVSGSTLLMQISSSGAITTTGVISGSNALSASHAATASFVTLAQTASFVTTAQTASFVTIAQTASFVATAQTASFVTLAQTASFVATAQTASFIANAQSASNAVNAITASSADSFLVRNTLTAQTIVVQTITSSVDFVTGSTQFGSISSNTHQFTGSVSISGSLTTSIAALGSAASLFLVSDGNVIKSRTAAQTLSDIAALPLAGGTLTGALSGTSATFSSSVTMGSLVVNDPGSPYYSFTNRIGGSTAINVNSISVTTDLGKFLSSGLSINSSGGVTNNMYQIAFGYKDTTGVYASSAIAGIAESSTGYNTGALIFATRALTTDTAPIERMRITSGGNVGIGTTSPGLPLTVYNATAGDDVGGIRIDRSATNREANLQFSTAGAIKWWFQLDNNTTDNFYLYDGLNNAYRMTWLQNGNVGIGTTSPNNRLSVNGNADFGTTSYAFNGPSQYGGLTFPRGQIFFSNSNTQNQLYIAGNAYNNASGVFAYRNSSQPALAFGLDNGEFSFLTAGNGTADATISWTTVIAITNGGNVTMGGTGATKLQSGTTAQRPSAAAGLIRYNTSLAELEMSNGSNWGSLQTKVMLGSSPSNPAESANDIKTYYPNATNGFYWIRQTGSTATSAYCVFRDAAGAEIAGGPWTVPIISNDANSNFATSGPTAAATFLSKCQAIGINTPGRGMESSRTTTEVYGAWLAVKRTIWEAYTPFVANGNTSGGSVLRMPMININGDGGASAHRLIYNTSLSTHIPPNESGDRCDANQLFCGWWSATDTSGWRTNDNNVPGPEDWGPSDSSNTAYNGAGVNSTLTVCVYK